MKRSLRAALLALALSVLLAVPAAADSGPEPALAIRVANAPEGLYYLDILERDEAGMDLFDSLAWSYDDPETLDQDLLSALEAAVPEGWHACTVQGTAHGPMWGSLTPAEEGVHLFSYAGVPEEFRVLLVTAEGEVFLSQPYTRRLLQDSLTLDWEGRTIRQRPPALAWLAQLLSTLLPTLVIEGLLLAAFGCFCRRNFLVFLIANLVTQLAFTAVLSLPAHPIPLMLLCEPVIMLAEALAYRLLFRPDRRRRAVACAVVSNLASAIAGFFVVIRVWNWLFLHL